MIRPRGIGLVVVAVLIFLLGGFTGVGWLLVFDAMLWGTIVVSAAIPWLAVGRLDVRRCLVLRAEQDLGPTAGEDVEIEVLVQNRGLLPAAFVTVLYNLDGSPAEAIKHRLFVAWHARRATLTAEASVKYERRGIQELPAPKVETGLPFGLFRRSRRAGGPMRVLVLPKVHPIDHLDFLGGASGALLREGSARVGEQVAGSRDYRTGDPWQYIHWRNTARSVDPQVKEFERAPQVSLTVALEIGREGAALENAVEIAASAGDSVCRNGGFVRVVSASVDITTGSRRELLETLALVDPAPVPRWSLGTAGEPLADGLLAIVMDDDDEGAQAIGLAAGRGVNVAAVVMVGFDGPGRGAATQTLRRAGAGVVECLPDGITSTLNALAAGTANGVALR